MANQGVVSSSLTDCTNEIDKGELHVADGHIKVALMNNGVMVDKHIIKQLYKG